MNVDLQNPNLSSTMPLDDGDAGTEQTIAVIRQLVEQGKKDPVINRAAIEMARGAGSFDDVGTVRAIYEFVNPRNGKFQFRRDVQGVETLRPAAATLELRAGDCDDFTTLLCSLFGTLGYRTRVVTISSHPSAPEIFTHIYPEVRVAGKWVPIDVARKDARFGLAPRKYFRKRVWDFESGEYEDISGLNGYNLGEVPLRGSRARPYNPRTRRYSWAGGRLPPGVSGLGQDDINWAGIAQAVTAGTTGAATIVRAVDTPAGYSFNPLTGQTSLPGLAPAPAGYINIGGTLMQTSTIMLIGGALLLFMMMRNR